MLKNRGNYISLSGVERGDGQEAFKNLSAYAQHFTFV